MASTERVGNLGYLGIAPQSVAGTPVPATDFVPLYEETVKTNRNLQDQAPIFGNKFENFAVVPGQRDHGGDVTVLAEPNTAVKFIDMLLTRGALVTAYTFTVTSANATTAATYTNNGKTFTVVSTISSGTTLLMTGTGVPQASGTLTKSSGTGDATITFSVATNTSDTWPFTLTSSGETYYTFDISTGNGLLKRFWGVQASKITPSFNNNEMQLKVSISALGSFEGREVSTTPTGSNPYTITLKTDYDPSPTTGLVVGDLIRFAKANGTTIDCTVASVASATTITTTTDVTSGAAGDVVYLRPQTVALNNLPTFLWSNTQFCFGATAAAALSATQLQVETSSMWELDHNFHDTKGEHRSGSQDPVSLVRTTGNAALTIKKFFRDEADIKYYNNLAKQACVIRHYAYSGGNTYELRVTLNNIVTDDPTPQLKAKELSFSNIKYHPIYDSSDAQAIAATVINTLTAIS